MGTPILSRAVVTVGATDSLPGTTYCFLAPYNLYTPESDLAVATGVLSSNADNTYEDNVLTPIKNLVRAGLLLTSKVLIYDSVANVSYHKTLHYSADKAATFATAIKGKNWTVGKGAGLPITGTFTPTRVSSRQ